MATTARVQALDRRVYERIAAGEVIERPANVVKELVENALDAGAMKVSTEVRGGGVELIRVRDDGAGMDREDALLAIQRYTTSKLASLDDLDTLGTLGFRGEALASIAAVSKMELVTKTADATTGTRISIQGGEVISVDDVGSTTGTAIEVRDLFYNVPARRRFMKGPGPEGARVTDAVQRLALTRLDVHFVHVVAGREVLNAPPASSLQDRAVAVLGRDTARYMFPIIDTDPDDKVDVSGIVGKPQLARPNRAQLYVSVNGRPVDAPTVAEAVRAAYGEILFRGRWPVAIVEVGVEPSRVDVNVHPAKREVLFRDAQMVAGAVEDGVRATLADADLVTEAAPRRREAPLDVGVPTEPEVDVSLVVPDVAEAGAASAQTDLAGGVLEEDRLRSALDFTPIVGEEPRSEDIGHIPSWLVSLRPVGQIMDTYIVCEGEDAMYLIDQHALAERLTYESIKASAAHGRLKQQTMLEPIVLQPTEGQLGVLEARRDALESLGFAFFNAEDGSLHVTALPSMLGQKLTQEEVDVLLQDLLSGETSGTVTTKEEAIRSMSCHLSIRAGQRLTPKQVVALLRGMAGSHDPLACVHGRPTAIRVTKGELERMFKRTE
ncbi:MAG: DNA mismatch repair endonuclease MutL [Thermoplasmata archaeon]|nr:MAG: DNA mismatch repair endonuclease MutL [Thermoplasmata archaeon]